MNCGSSEQSAKADNTTNAKITATGASSGSNTRNTSNKDTTKIELSKDLAAKTIKEQDDLINISLLPDWVNFAFYVNFDEIKKNKKLEEDINKHAINTFRLIARQIGLSDYTPVPPSKINAMLGGFEVPNNPLELQNEENIISKINLSFIMLHDRDINSSKSLKDHYKTPYKTLDKTDIYRDNAAGMLITNNENRILVSNEKSITENLNRLKGDKSVKNLSNDKPISESVKDLYANYPLGWFYLNFDKNIHIVIDDLWAQVSFLIAFAGADINNTIKKLGGIDTIKKNIDNIKFIYFGAKMLEGENINFDIGIIMSNKEYADKLVDIINKLKDNALKNKKINDKIKKKITDAQISYQNENTPIITIKTTVDEMLNRNKI